MKKKLCIIGIIILVFLLAFLYFVYTYPPFYDGKATIDLRNYSWKTIRGATLTYKDSNIVVNIPEIKPQERIIVIPNSNDVNVPVTELYLNYSGQRYTLINEYRPNVNEAAIIVFRPNSVKVKDLRYVIQRIINCISFKPYFKEFKL